VAVLIVPATGALAIDLSHCLPPSQKRRINLNLTKFRIPASEEEIHPAQPIAKIADHQKKLDESGFSIGNNYGPADRATLVVPVKDLLHFHVLSPIALITLDIGITQHFYTSISIISISTLFT
jgi:hypothetical protein